MWVRAKTTERAVKNGSVDQKALQGESEDNIKGTTDYLGHIPESGHLSS